MNYIKLTENNEHEGERWRFYIPVEGNEIAMQEIKKFLQVMNIEGYNLSLTEYPESDVDVLVDNSGVGYLCYENKLEGFIKLPEWFSRLDLTRTYTDQEVQDMYCNLTNFDFLYKGGLRDCMEVAK